MLVRFYPLFEIPSAQRESPYLLNQRLQEILSLPTTSEDQVNKRANVLTGRTQICKTTGAVKHAENRCTLGRTTGREQEHFSVLLRGFLSVVQYFMSASHRAAPQVPECSHRAVGSIPSPASHGRMRSCGWVGQEGGGRRHHPPNQDIHFLIPLFALLLAAA